MFVRHLKGFQSFLHKHGRISKISTRALEGLSDTGSRIIRSSVSTGVYQPTFTGLVR
jgi:hypothetical protein